MSDEFERFLKNNDIEHCTSTPLWPQANREVERQNRSLLKALRSAKAEKKTIWTDSKGLNSLQKDTSQQYRSHAGQTPVQQIREIRS